MKQAAIATSGESTFKIGLTYRELGIFFLLLFLNIKFVTIVITHNRSVFIDAIVYLLFIATFNYSNWTYKSLAKTAIIVGVYTLINFSPYKLNVLLPLLVMQSVSGIRYSRYLLINFVVFGTFLIIMYILHGEGVTFSDNSFLVERKIRMSFGFNTPNVAALHYYCFIINGVLLLHFSKYKKHVPLYLLLITPLWVYIYMMTVSRSFLLAIVVLYGAFMYYRVGEYFNKKNRFNLINYTFIFLLIILSAVTLFFSLQKNNFLLLDRLLSKRLTFYDWFLQTLTPMDFLFGSGTFYNFVIDSSYLRLLFEGGIIFFIVICYFYMLAATKMVNKKAWIPICVIFSMMAYGMMESMLLYSMLIGTNIYWVTLYYYYRDGKMEL